MNLYPPTERSARKKVKQSAQHEVSSRGLPRSYYAGSSRHDYQDAAEESVRSHSIPIGKDAMRRTASELKLTEDEAMADFQDYVFFSRLLSGISKKQQEGAVSDKFLKESDECLAHIIGTRNGSVDTTTDDEKNPSNDGTYLDERSSRVSFEEDEGFFLMEL
jgi:hypothetical protein